MTLHLYIRKYGVLLLLCFLLIPPTLTHGYSPTNIPHSAFRTPHFIIGANYEGPTDRAWMMWEPDKFDANLISQDFARARSVGINTLRIFVQRPLRDDINRGDYSKLDAVTTLARRHNLQLILTMTDWPEPDLSRAADLNRRIAAHLAGEPSIMAYDVKNEPQFTDVAGAIYPTGTTVPLQSLELLANYDEQVPRASIGEYRRNAGGLIPSRMSDDQAYLFANYYELYRDFLDDASGWVNRHPSTTTLDYIDSPNSSRWRPYLDGIDATLAAWVGAQMAPLRAADPGRPITVGYSNIVFAKMPSNARLDFHSIHRFTQHGYSGLNATFLVLENLKLTFAPQPLMLEEFGYPGQAKNGDGGVTGYDPRTTANLEAAIWAYLYTNGYMGGMKWMLNNFPQGYDPAQNSFGMFDNNGQPKITAHTLRALALAFESTAPGSLAFSGIRSDEASAVQYAFTSGSAHIIGGRQYSGEVLTYSADAPGNLIVTTDGGTITLFSTTAATVTLHLPALLGVPTAGLGRISLVGQDPSGATYTATAPTLSGDMITLSPSRALHTYRLTAVPAAFDPAGPAPGLDTVYFPQTGHNLGGEFLRYWRANGGLPIFGYPLSEQMVERGYTVQYFERNRFELHPDNQPPYNVLLGRLGADMTARREFPRIEPFQSNPDHIYFPETSHSLNYAFLGYWQRHGGLPVFGYPISEEIRERNTTDGKEYTVQYFERARFEYHPEYLGSDAEVLLGLLGADVVRARGWQP